MRGSHMGTVPGHAPGTAPVLGRIPHALTTRRDHVLRRVKARDPQLREQASGCGPVALGRRRFPGSRQPDERPNHPRGLPRGNPHRLHHGISP